MNLSLTPYTQAVLALGLLYSIMLLSLGHLDTNQIPPPVPSTQEFNALIKQAQRQDQFKLQFNAHYWEERLEHPELITSADLLLLKNFNAQIKSLKRT